jgi:hypothetical protein
VLENLTKWLSKPGSMREACDYLASARRMLATKPAAGSPILRKRSLGRRFDVFEIPLADLKMTANGINASINDCFLAGMMGGFQRYHTQMGVKVEHMPIGFPISLRTSNDAAGGNKFTGCQFTAPIGLLDPLKRIQHIQHFVRDTRAEPALDIVMRIAPAMVRLPTPLLTAIAGSMTAAQDAQISNIPGIARPIHMAGAQVTHLWPFAPTAGCGMMIAMVSHFGRCCIGINSDRAAVTDPELMTACLREGMDEILALRKPLALVRTSPPRKAVGGRIGKIATKKRGPTRSRVARARD